MGANNSKTTENKITVDQFKDALEKQRKLYEERTKTLLQVQRTILTPTTAQAPSCSTTGNLYPNLPPVPSQPPVLSQRPVPSQPPQTPSMQPRRVAPTLSPSLAPSAPPVASFSAIEIQTRSSSPVRSRYESRVSHSNNVSTRFCPNLIHGCLLKIKSNDVRRHLKECIFRDISCPIDAIYKCSWTGKSTQLIDHFEEEHSECRGVKVNKEDKIHTAYSCHFLHLVDLGAFNFLLHILVEEKKKKLIFGVQSINTKAGASQWTYAIRIYDKNEPRRLFEYVDSCQPDSIPFESLQIGGKLATVSLDYAKSFSETEEITYKLFLNNTRNNTSAPPKLLRGRDSGSKTRGRKHHNSRLSRS